MPRPKQIQSDPPCPLCGQPMPVQYDCNFEQMVCRAGWHMDFKPKMTFCGQCSKDLLTAVNFWYKHVNKSGNYDKLGGNVNAD